MEMLWSVSFVCRNWGNSRRN